MISLLRWATFSATYSNMTSEDFFLPPRHSKHISGFGECCSFSWFPAVTSLNRSLWAQGDSPR